MRCAWMTSISQACSNQSLSRHLQAEEAWWHSRASSPREQPPCLRYPLMRGVLVASALRPWPWGSSASMGRAFTCPALLRHVATTQRRAIPAPAPAPANALRPRVTQPVCLLARHTVHQVVRSAASTSVRSRHPRNVAGRVEQGHRPRSRVSMRATNLTPWYNAYACARRLLGWRTGRRRTTRQQPRCSGGTEPTSRCARGQQPRCSAGTGG